MAKLSHEYVKSEVEKRGYELLGKYERSSKSMAVKCQKGHQIKKTWNSIQQGQGCAVCDGQVMTHDFAQEYIESQGYKLHSVYKNAITKLDIECPHGHVTQKTWQKFKAGQRCVTCKGPKIDHAYVKEQFEKAGYKLISNSYKNSETPLLFLCDKKHLYKMKWSTFQTGARCNICAGRVVYNQQVMDFVESIGYSLESNYSGDCNDHLKLICDKNHHANISWSNLKKGHRCGRCAWRISNPQEVYDGFAAKGYKVLDKYNNAKEEMLVVCPNNHVIKRDWSRFIQGVGCPTCNGYKVWHDDVEKAFCKEGYRLLSTYKNAKQKLKYVCDKRHNNFITWNNFQTGKRCPDCSSSGFDKSKPGILYYVKFTTPDGELYKVGITNNTPQKRFSNEPCEMKVLAVLKFKDGAETRRFESHLLRKYKAYQYKGKALVSGNTECFTIDVLNHCKDTPKSTQRKEVTLFDYMTNQSNTFADAVLAA